MRRRQSSSTYALITATLFLATKAWTQTDSQPQFPDCWETCFHSQQSICDSADTDLSCICYLLSNPNEQPAFLRCLENHCFIEDALSPFAQLSTNCTNSRTRLTVPLVSSISATVAMAGLDITSATAPIRSHEPAKLSRSAASAASSMAMISVASAQVRETGILTTSSAPGGVVTATVTATSTATASGATATAKTNQNGGTVLDTAGSGSSRVRIGSLWALGAVLGVAWCWCWC